MWIRCTSEADITVSNSTQCVRFIGELKKILDFWSDGQ